MKQRYEKHFDASVLAREQEIICSYQTFMKTYEPLFSALGYTLVYHPCWELQKRTGAVEQSGERLPFQNGYRCYYACSLQNGGETVKDANGCILQHTWLISGINHSLGGDDLYVFEAYQENIAPVLNGWLENLEQTA